MFNRFGEAQGYEPVDSDYPIAINTYHASMVSVNPVITHERKAFYHEPRDAMAGRHMVRTFFALAPEIDLWMDANKIFYLHKQEFGFYLLFKYPAQAALFKLTWL